MVVAGALSTIGSVGSAIAAVAALVTVWFARRTVTEARESRKESSAAHVEAMRQQAELLAATRTAHEREMAERARALASELVLQRLRQLDVVADLLRQTADLGRHEAQYPPVRPDASQFSLTRIPGMLLRLEAAVIVAERLGGPPLDLAMKVVVDNRSMPTQPMKVVGDAMAALRTLNDLAQNHPGFTLEDSAPSP